MKKGDLVRLALANGAELGRLVKLYGALWVVISVKSEFEGYPVVVKSLATGTILHVTREELVEVADEEG